MSPTGPRQSLHTIIVRTEKGYARRGDTQGTRYTQREDLGRYTWIRDTHREGIHTENAHRGYIGKKDVHGKKIYADKRDIRSWNIHGEGINI